MPEAEVSERIAESVGADRGIVVKPTVSAGSKDTARYASRAEDPHALGAAATHAASLLDRGRAVMVQPSLGLGRRRRRRRRRDRPGVPRRHLPATFRKGPLLALGADPVAGLYAEETISAREPKDEQLAVAATVLDAAPPAPASPSSTPGSTCCRARTAAGPAGVGAVRAVVLPDQLTGLGGVSRGGDAAAVRR